MENDRHLITMYKAMYMIDGIEEPFRNFGPDHPKIGDKVRPDNYFSDDFTYKLDRVPSNSKLTRDEVGSSLWKCTGIRHTEWHTYVTFKSIDKINGRKRSLTYKDAYKLVCEIADMPERSRLIIDYKNGKLTLEELLEIFSKKRYHALIWFKSVHADMNADEYLQTIKELRAEGKI